MRFDLLYSSTMAQAAGEEQVTRGLGECGKGSQKATVIQEGDRLRWQTWD